MPLERTDDRTVADAVAVGLAAGIEARVECRGSRLRRRYADGFRQPRVQGADQHVRIDLALECKRRNLRERVNAGIGPSRAGDRDVAAVESAEGLFDEPLNRGA